MKDMRTDFRVSFSSRLRELIKTNNCSRSQISKKIECSVSCISKWLDMSREPTLSNIWKLANFFGCSIDTLVGKQSLDK